MASIPIFNPPATSSSSSVDISNLATKEELSLTLVSVNDTITSSTTNTAITSKLLTGYPTASNIAPVLTTDTILVGLKKVDSKVAAFANSMATINTPQTLYNKTFGDLLTANAGATITGGLAVSTTVVLNSGGGATSAGSSGVYFEEAGVSTNSYMRVSADRTKMELKAPAGGSMTLNQSLASTDAPSFTGMTVTGISISQRS